MTPQKLSTMIRLAAALVLLPVAPLLLAQESGTMPPRPVASTPVPGASGQPDTVGVAGL